MKKKTLATTLITAGTVLIFVSALGLFLILIDSSSHEYFFALSHSMEPTIGKGECVKVELGVDIGEVYAAPKPYGDIIAFHKPGYSPDIILHRAIGSGTDASYYLITQGDANAGQDGWRVRETDLIGRVVEINPSFWTYSYIFWGAILSIGIVLLVGGVVVRQSKRVEAHRTDNSLKPEAVAKPAIVEARPKRKFFCRYCGAENKLDASYCEACGKKF